MNIARAKARGISDPWLRDLLARRPYKVAMVAFAAKTACILWAMLIKGEAYRADSVWKGNQSVMANGQETGIETLRLVIARHSLPE